jgi:hypothetical protein
MFGLEKSVVTAIGAGLLVLALIGAIIGLINYGQKLGELKAENQRLTGEIEDANAWKDDMLEKNALSKQSLEDLQAAADAAEIARLDALARPPETIVRWRETITEVPVAVPLGDCDRAATNAWDVLKEAGLIRENTWENSSIYPSSPPSVDAWLDAARLEQDLTGPSLNLYLSAYPNHLWNESVGTYHLSTRPLSLVDW